MTNASSWYTKHLLFLQHCEKSFDELVHQGDHRLSMREVFITFLVVESLITPNDSQSHQKEIFTQAGVSPFGDPTFFEDGARFVNSRIGATESDEILISFKSIDGLDFGKEVGSRDFTDARDAGDDVHLQILSLPHKCHQCLGQLIELLLEKEQALGTVLDQRPVGGDSDRRRSQSSQIFDGKRETSAPWRAFNARASCSSVASSIAWAHG